MGKKKKGNWDNMEPQKSSAAQYLTYIASYGITNEKFEIRYENENIWMSQKMLAAVYGVEVPNIAYHLRKLFEDGEIDKETSIKEILIDIETEDPAHDGGLEESSRQVLGDVRPASAEVQRRSD